MWVVAAIVGEYLLQGAIQHIGGRLMSSALGGATITDVRTWIREAVAELEAFIAAKLDQLVIQQLAADMEQAKDNIKEYANFRNSSERSRNRYLVEFADTHCRSLISVSLNYKQTFFVSMAAMAYWSFARYALYLDDRASAHITSMKDSVDVFLVKASENFQYLLDRQTSDYRIKVVGSPMLEAPGIRIYVFFATLDGHHVGTQVISSEEDDARRQVQGFVDRQIRPAVEKNFQDFREHGLKSLRLVNHTYDEMCRKIHRSYTPPPNLPFDLSIAPTVAADLLRAPTAAADLLIAPTAAVTPLPTTILMPGAIIIGSGENNA